MIENLERLLIDLVQTYGRKTDRIKPSCYPHFLAGVIHIIKGSSDANDDWSMPQPVQRILSEPH